MIVVRNVLEDRLTTEQAAQQQIAGVPVMLVGNGKRNRMEPGFSCSRRGQWIDSIASFRGDHRVVSLLERVAEKVLELSRFVSAKSQPCEVIALDVGSEAPRCLVRFGRYSKGCGELRGKREKPFVESIEPCVAIQR